MKNYEDVVEFVHTTPETGKHEINLDNLLNALNDIAERLHILEANNKNTHFRLTQIETRQDPVKYNDDKDQLGLQID